MTPDPFLQLLTARASAAGVAIDGETARQFAAYFRLLRQWNDTINLTSLPLDPVSGQAIDRLFIEPVAAARLAVDVTGGWVDVGSGGGSPAIPFRIVQRRARLTMVESRARKAAFLSEAIRTLGLEDVAVVNERFETVAPSFPSYSAELVTVRAVRCDPSLSKAIHTVMSRKGRLFLFQAAGANGVPPLGFESDAVVQLGTQGGEEVHVLTPMFHVEQSD